MKFIEVKDYVIAIDSIAYVTQNSTTVAIQMKGENFPIHARYKTVTEARESYVNISKILLENP